MQMRNPVRAIRLDLARGLMGGLAAVSFTALACTPSGAPPPALFAAPVQATALGATACPSLPSPPASASTTIAPDTRVPDFAVATEACDVYDSRELVGKRAFVVVFFAS